MNTSVAGLWALAAASATALVVGFAGFALARQLPVGLSPDVFTRLREPSIAGHPALLGAQLLVAVYFAAAGIGFALRADRTGAALLGWFGAGSMLAASARVSYFVFPTLYSDFVSIGDLQRVCFYGLLLVGSAQEIGQYWQGLADAAVLEERRRIARDIHDGVAQELAYIWSQTKRLTAEGKLPEEADALTAAAARGLDESRRAIAALTRPVDESLDVALAQTVEEVAQRSGAHVRLELDEVHVPGDTREALLRIAREAVNNAIKHSSAETIVVRLKQDGVLRLEVIDDGRGFDPASNGTGFGLISMRERAEQLGADFHIFSEPGGSTIRVELA